MDVCENSGTPKSSILIGFSITNHPFWGIPIFGNTQMMQFAMFFQDVYKFHQITCAHLAQEVKDDLVHLCNKKLAWISAPIWCKAKGTFFPTAKVANFANRFVIFGGVDIPWKQSCT